MADGSLTEVLEGLAMGVSMLVRWHAEQKSRRCRPIPKIAATALRER